MKTKNPQEQLLAWLKDGTLNHNSVQIAYRRWIHDRTDLPIGVKNILTSKEGGGLLAEMFLQIAHVIGAVELSYRRGYGAEQDDSRNKPKPHN